MKRASKKLSILIALTVIGALGLVGCSDDSGEQNPDLGKPDMLVTDGALSDTTQPDGTLADGTTADQAVADAPAGLTVKVTYGGTTVTVDLNTLQAVTFDGTPHSKLTDVVAAAVPPGTTMDSLQADFASGDGFKPGNKSDCQGLVPVSGANFDKGFVDRATRRLGWDASLGYPKCLSVKDLAEVTVTDK